MDYVRFTIAMLDYSLCAVSAKYWEVHPRGYKTNWIVDAYPIYASHCDSRNLTPFNAVYS